MRRIDPRHVRALGIGITVLSLLGAGPFEKKRDPFKKPDIPLKADETIAELAYVRVEDNIRVEGVGLVVGLNGTGSDPEPSVYRAKLLDEMRKASVENPNAMLADPSTSLVIVRGTIPVGVSTSDRWDVTLEQTPNSTTQSLEGGWLMMCELSVVGFVNGQPLEGQVLAEVGGPVMTGTAEKPDDLTVGRVLGGAHARKDMPYTLVIKDRRRSAFTSALLQKVINQRFHMRKGVNQEGMAEAKTDEYLVLNVPSIYHQNQARYFQVIQHLPIVSNVPELTSRRMETWSKELLDPKTAGVAALKLEGVGRNAIETLKAGLASPNAQVRFFAAEALAYLNDASGVDVLVESAIQTPEFRAHAFAALAAMDQSASILRLQEMMAQADPEVRYGAFNALRTLDPFHPALGRVPVLDAPEPPPSSDDGMALRFGSTRRRARPRPDDPFELYIVDCDGPPMVHVSRNRRAEIVVFGRDQKLLTPAVLGGAGPILLNAALNDETIEIQRIGASRSGMADVRVNSPLALGEVIRQAANLGAQYPQILTVLEAAERQKNLPGPLVQDAMPSPDRTYDQAQIAGVDATKTDAEVQQTRAEVPEKPRRVPLMNRLFRNIGEGQTAKPDPLPATPAPSATGNPAPKTDESVERTGLDPEPPAKRESLLRKMFRRGDQ